METISALLVFGTCVCVVISSQVTIELDEVALDASSPSCRMHYRANASNTKSVWLFPRENLVMEFCLTKTHNVSIQNVAYSNDGGGDIVTVSLDGKVGEIATTVRFKGGLYWDVFFDSGPIGEPKILTANKPHVISLNLTLADRFGIELDSLVLELDGNVTEDDIRCPGSGTKWGNKSFVENTCHPPAVLPMQLPVARQLGIPETSTPSTTVVPASSSSTSFPRSQSSTTITSKPTSATSETTTSTTTKSTTTTPTPTTSTTTSTATAAVSTTTASTSSTTTASTTSTTTATATTIVASAPSSSPPTTTTTTTLRATRTVKTTEPAERAAMPVAIPSTTTTETTTTVSKFLWLITSRFPETTVPRVVSLMMPSNDDDDDGITTSAQDSQVMSKKNPQCRKSLASSASFLPPTKNVSSSVIMVLSMLVTCR